MYWKLNLSPQDAYYMYTVPELLKTSKVIGEYDILEELEVKDPAGEGFSFFLFCESFKMKRIDTKKKHQDAKLIYATSTKPAPMIYPRQNSFFSFF